MDTAAVSVIIDLVHTLSKKTEYNKSERMVYIKGLNFTEKWLDLCNKTIEKQLDEDATAIAEGDQG